MQPAVLRYQLHLLSAELGDGFDNTVAEDLSVESCLVSVFNRAGVLKADPV